MTEKHDLQYISVDDIVPTSWNANQEDDKTFDLLVSEISETGFIDSITVVPLEDGTYRVIGGEHRWRAAKASGYEEIPCLVLDGDYWSDEDRQKFASVRMNIIKGKLNPEKFAALYTEMADKYGKDQLQKLFGFTNKKAMEKATKGLISNLKKSLPKEMHKDIEDKVKDLKTTDDIGAVVQELYAEHGDTLAHSYMILSQDKQEHVYIRMKTRTRKALDKVMWYCEVANEDINSVLGEIIQDGVRARAELLDVKDAPSEEAPGSKEENPYK